MPQLDAKALDPRTKVFNDAVNAGFSWLTIVELILQYGLPIVEQLLPQAIAALAAGVPFKSVLAWFVTAALAIETNNPVPPVPTA